MRHEMRLLYRDWAQQRYAVMGVGILVLGLHAYALQLVPVLSHDLSVPVVLVLFAGTLALAFGLLAMVVRSLLLVVQALHERGDIDLLLSSPMRVENIFAVRASSIALMTAAEFALFVLPFANVFVLAGELHWARGYVVLPMLACLATSISLWSAFWLFKLVGARHIRAVARVAAVLLSACSFSVVQVCMLVGNDPPRGAAWSRILPGLDSALWIPARVVSGEPLWGAAAALSCVALFAGTVAALARRFGEAVTRTSSVFTRGQRSGRAMPRYRTGTIIALVHKDLRVALRDPDLAVQLLVLPLALSIGAAFLPDKLAWRGVPLAWLLMVPVAGLLACTTAQRMASMEEAPDLIRSAPIGPLQIVSSQLLASLAPALFGVVVCGAMLAFEHPGLARWLVSCSVGHALSQALPYLRLHRRRARRTFELRHLLALPVAILQAIGAALWTGIALIGFLLWA